jgi:hypothetical protein
MKEINPFLVNGYVSKKYFCDRQQELTALTTAIKNGNNVTLVSPRRMGKTGLIFRVFEACEKEATLYVDILPTRSVVDFIKIISEAILRKFPEKTSIGRKFLNFIKSLRPLFSFDSITGEPQIQIVYQTEPEKLQTLHNIFQFLNAQDIHIVVAIDEFQQITEYPEKNMEAILRTEIQHLKNVNFIFCGSKRSIMIDMFANAKRPFYASTQFLNLDKINEKKYIQFIIEKFKQGNMNIEKESIDFILEWTKTHTFYTQSLCNKIYAYSTPNITLTLVKKACKEILDQQATVFLQLRQLLTSAQWNYLIAIAKEGKIEQPTAQQFLMKHKIGTASNSKRLLKSLCEKELILETAGLEKTNYQVYDVFFDRWLNENY